MFCFFGCFTQSELDSVGAYGGGVSPMDEAAVFSCLFPPCMMKLNFSSAIFKPHDRVFFGVLTGGLGSNLQPESQVSACAVEPHRNMCPVFFSLCPPKSSSSQKKSKKKKKHKHKDRDVGKC